MRTYFAALGVVGSLMLLWAALIGLQTAVTEGNLWSPIG